MPGEIRTRRWNDPKKKGDGLRLLVCRFRPRALPKKDETWDEWNADLGPSRELHAAIYGKHGAPIAWKEFEKRYVKEMKGQRSAIAALADRVAKGETITLLCSSACEDDEHCHRSILKRLIDQYTP